MVMTAQTNPKHSRKGILLACMVALGGVMVTPLWACPKESKAQTRAEKAVKPKKAFTVFVPVAPRAPTAPLPPLPPAPAASTTFEQFMTGFDDESLERRMEALERHLERLHKEIERIMGEARRGGREAPRADRERPRTRQEAPPERRAGRGEGRGRASQASTADCNEVVVRRYELSEGKLEAILELMVRSDVPIRVRPDGNHIEVHAVEKHQMIFSAFSAMIAGEDTVEAYELPEGKLKALAKLMVRSDVPILVETGSTDIKVHGNDLEQLIFKAFVDMIHPGRAQRASGGEVQVYANALANLAGQYESQATAHFAELRALQAAYRSLEQQVQGMERQADRLSEKADRLRDKADDLQDQADELRDKADELSGSKSRSMLAKAESLSQKAEALQQEAEVFDEQAEVLEDQAEAMEDAAEEIEDRLEDLEEEAEDAEDDRDDDD